MDRALNRQILIELEFLLKNDHHINEDISDLASEKWKEFKGEVSWLGKEAGLAAKNIAKGDITRVKEFGKAISLGANDAVSLFEKDPRALIQGFIDIVSLVEPTGIADIINAGIYLYNNEKTMGIISLITGGGLTHKDTLYTMSKGGVYVSTCTFESWGITALEALSHGLPLLLVTDTTGKHSSTTIATSSNHYRNISKAVKSNEIEGIIKEMNTISLTDRQNIAKMTQEKHSLEKFKETLNKVFRDVL